MTRIVVQTKISVTTDFGESVTEISATQVGTEGNPAFFASTARELAERCKASAITMLRAEYGTRSGLEE